MGVPASDKAEAPDPAAWSLRVSLGSFGLAALCLTALILGGIYWINGHAWILLPLIVLEYLWQGLAFVGVVAGVIWLVCLALTVLVKREPENK